MKVQKGNIITVKKGAKYVALEDSGSVSVKCNKLYQGKPASSTVFNVRFESIKVVEAKKEEPTPDVEGYGRFAPPEEVEASEEVAPPVENDLNSEEEETTI